MTTQETDSYDLNSSVSKPKDDKKTLFAYLGVATFIAFALGVALGYWMKSEVQESNIDTPPVSPSPPMDVKEDSESITHEEIYGSKVALVNDTSISVEDKTVSFKIDPSWLPLSNYSKDSFGTIKEGPFQGCYTGGMPTFFFEGLLRLKGDKISPCPILKVWMTKEWSQVDATEEVLSIVGTKERKQKDLAVLEQIYFQESLQGIDLEEDSLTAPSVSPKYQGLIWGNTSSGTNRYLPFYVSSNNNQFRGVAFIENSGQDMLSLEPIYRAVLYNPETTILVDIRIPLSETEPFKSWWQDFEDRLQKAEPLFPPELPEKDRNAKAEPFFVELSQILQSVRPGDHNEAGMTMKETNSLIESLEFI